MKTVVISGYYGYENTGDEALLASIIQALQARLPGLRIIVLSARPAETAGCYGVEAVDRLKIAAIAAALRRTDLLISGGGSLLQDVTGPWTIPYYLGITAAAKMMGKPVMFYAQGIGPVNKSLGKKLIRLIADRVDMITLRDRASADLLREIGVTRPPVEVTADPVFGLDTAGPEASQIYQELGLPIPDKPVCGIFIREWRGLFGYKEAVAGMADRLTEKGWQTVFVPMQFPEDVRPAREAAGIMKAEPWVIDQRLTLGQTLGLIKSMEIVVGMRLHALIMAAACAVPMLGLSYDPKVSDFLRSINQPVLESLERITTKQLLQETERALDKTDETKASLEGAGVRLRNLALKNGDIAVQLLNGKGAGN